MHHKIHFGKSDPEIESESGPIIGLTDETGYTISLVKRHVEGQEAEER